MEELGRQHIENENSFKDLIKMWQQTDVETQETLQSILSKRELNVEAFICSVAAMLVANNDANAGTSQNAEENNQALITLAEEKMAQVGILVNHKFSGILKDYLLLLQENRKAGLFSSIQMPNIDLCISSLNYRDCFIAWIDSPFVSYRTTNKLQLGKLSAKESLILHVFAFLTCRRIKGDNLFAICFSGASTVGKSTMWENPLYENAHSFVNDSGVGRWSVKKKNVLFYHDININVLVKGKDSEKFKTISRTEVTVCKVFGKTEVLPPLFVCITSNMRIHDHQFAQEVSPKQPFGRSINCKSHFQQQQINSPDTREVINAVQNRILECYVHQRPILDTSKLPQSGNFSRMNGILGMYEYVISILENHTPESFFTSALLIYALTGLVDNHGQYSQIGDSSTIKTRIQNVLTKMLHPQLATSYINRLC